MDDRKAPLDGLNLLLIEDVEAIRRLVCKLLDSLGCAHVSEAADYEAGREALAAYTYDAILLDYDLDGTIALPLLRQMRREAEHANCRTPVLMLTANADVETVRRCVEAGADSYLVKPVMPARLGERIRKVLDKRPDRQASEGAPPATEVSWTRI
ncbi:response regulator [Maricaulis sp. CAU 1757]